MKNYAWVAFLIIPLTSVSQKFISEKSTVTFFSSATVEDITAQNAKSQSLLDIGSGEIAFSIPIREFIFAKSLMQEHFNEKYMETEKFPKATFQGKLSGFSQEVKGVQSTKAQGKLTIHGMTRDVEVTGTLEVQKDVIVVRSKFHVRLEDYDVSRPQLLWQNIAEEVEVSIDFTYKPYEK